MSKTKIEKTEENVAKFDIVIEATKAKEAYNNALKKIASGMNVPGFRKGKVPQNIIEARIGIEGIKQQAIEDLFPAAFSAAVQENNLEIAQQPYIEKFEFEAGKELKITVNVELKPEVILGEYKNIEVQYEEFKNDKDALDKEIEHLKQRMATLNSVKGRKSNATDTVIFDFEGSANGKKIEGGSAKNYSLDLANSNFIPGFAEGLVGHDIEEEFTINVKFPEDYHSEELKGADAEFKIKLIDIKEKTYPEVNDEFAKKVTSGKIKTIDDLKADIQKYLDENEKSNNEKIKEDAIFGKIIDEAKIDIQKAMIEREKEAVKAESKQRATAQGLDFDEMIKKEGTEKVEKQLEDEAIKRIRNSLVIEKIADLEQIKVGKDDIFAHINMIAQQYGDKKMQAIEEIAKNPSSIALISQQVATEKVAKMLVEKNNFKATAKKGNK